MLFVFCLFGAKILQSPVIGYSLTDCVYVSPGDWFLLFLRLYAGRATGEIDTEQIFSFVQSVVDILQ